MKYENEPKIKKLQNMAISVNSPEIVKKNYFNGKKRINLCSHPVYVLIPGKDKKWEVLYFLTYKNPPRVQYHRRYCENGCDYEMAASGIENLPEQVNGIEYLVSRELLRVAIKMYGRYVREYHSSFYGFARSATRIRTVQRSRWRTKARYPSARRGGNTIFVHSSIIHSHVGTDMHLLLKMYLQREDKEDGMVGETEAV